jgi:hypothetical protein
MDDRVKAAVPFLQRNLALRTLANYLPSDFQLNSAMLVGGGALIGKTLRSH